SPRLNEAFAASSRWRSAVRPVTSRASKVVVGAVPFLEGPGGGGIGMGCACFAGGGDDRSRPRSCCAVVTSFAGATVGDVVAGVVAAAGATAGAAVVDDVALLLFDLLAFFLVVAFFGCCGESRPWNAWAEAPPEISSVS